MIDTSCLDKYKNRQDYEDLVQEYVLAILEGKEPKEAMKCAVKSKNLTDRNYTQKAPSLYNEEGECLDEEYYFRTDREDGETGSRLRDGTKEYVAKMAKTLDLIKCFITVDNHKPGGKSGKYPVYFSRSGVVDSFHRRGKNALLLLDNTLDKKKTIRHLMYKRRKK